MLVTVLFPEFWPTSTFFCLKGTTVCTASCLQLHKRAERIASVLGDKGHLNAGDNVVLLYPPGRCWVGKLDLSSITRLLQSVKSRKAGPPSVPTQACALPSSRGPRHLGQLKNQASPGGAVQRRGSAGPASAVFAVVLPLSSLLPGAMVNIKWIHEDFLTFGNPQKKCSVSRSI